MPGVCFCINLKSLTFFKGSSIFLWVHNLWIILWGHQRSSGTYHYVSWLQILCFPPCGSQTRGIPAGSVCRRAALVNWSELRGGNSVPAPPAASVAPSLSSPLEMEVEGSAVTALTPHSVSLFAGSAGGPDLQRAGRRDCVPAEGSGCRWSRSQSWVPRGGVLGSSSQEAKVVLIREEVLLQLEHPGTCAHFQLHPHYPPLPDHRRRSRTQSQIQSQSWSGPASQRRSLWAEGAAVWAAGAWMQTDGGKWRAGWGGWWAAGLYCSGPPPGGCLRSWRDHLDEYMKDSRDEDRSKDGEEKKEDG